MRISPEMLMAAAEAVVNDDGFEVFQREKISHQAEILSEWASGKGKYAKKTTAFLWGNIGTGKTTLLRAFRRIFESEGKKLNIHLARSLADKATVDMAGFLAEVKRQYLAVDDLGVEPEKVFCFGNPIYPMRTLLEERYARRLPTLISANISPKMMLERYENRVADRLGQVAFSVPFPGDSLRTHDFF